MMLFSFLRSFVFLVFPASVLYLDAMPKEDQLKAEILEASNRRRYCIGISKDETGDGSDGEVDGQMGGGELDGPVGGQVGGFDIDYANDENDDYAISTTPAMPEELG